MINTRYRLVHVASGKPTKPFTLNRPMTIGSDSEKCQIQLKSKHGIRPEHCRLEMFNGKVWLVTLPNALTFIHGSEFEGRIELKNKLPFQVGTTEAGILYLEPLPVPCEAAAATNAQNSNSIPQGKSSSRNDPCDPTSLLLSTPTTHSEISFDDDIKKRSETAAKVASSEVEVENDSQSQSLSGQRTHSSEDERANVQQTVPKGLRGAMASIHDVNKRKVQNTKHPQVSESTESQRNDTTQRHGPHLTEKKIEETSQSLKVATNTSQSSAHSSVIDHKENPSSDSKENFETENQTVTSSKSTPHNFKVSKENVPERVELTSSGLKKSKRKRKDATLTVTVSPRYHGILKIGNFEVPRKWLPHDGKLVFEQTSTPTEVRRSTRPRIATDRYYPSPPSTSKKNNKKKISAASKRRTRSDQKMRNARESVLEVVKSASGDITRTQLIEYHQQKYGTLSVDEIQKTIDLLISETKDLIEENNGQNCRLRLAAHAVEQMSKTVTNSTGDIERGRNSEENAQSIHFANRQHSVVDDWSKLHLQESSQHQETANTTKSGESGCYADETSSTDHLDTEQPQFPLSSSDCTNVESQPSHVINNSEKRLKENELGEKTEALTVSIPS
jgi:hypothetical protein